MKNHPKKLPAQPKHPTRNTKMKQALTAHRKYTHTPHTKPARPRPHETCPRTRLPAYLHATPIARKSTPGQPAINSSNQLRQPTPAINSGNQPTHPAPKQIGRQPKPHQAMRSHSMPDQSIIVRPNRVRPPPMTGCTGCTNRP